MRAALIAGLASLACGTALAQQANVNLDYNPQKNTDNLASFGVLSAGDVDSEKSIAGFLNDPDVNRKVDYLFVGQGTEEAKGRMGLRCVALHEALRKHGVEHEYYVGGYAGHDWATWRHLVFYRFLPGLWRARAEAVSFRARAPEQDVVSRKGENR